MNGKWTNLLMLTASLSLPALALSQTVVARTIRFEGASQTQAELLALSGLTPGATLTKDQIEIAAHRLDDSRLFSSIEYHTTPGVLTFTLEPAAKSQMLRVVYGNFVWFTQGELNQEVQAKLPLFNGSVPADGGIKDQVQQALVSIVKQKGVAVTVEERALSGGRIEYRIASPPVIVTELNIENVRWESDPTLREVRRALIGIDYQESVTQRAVHDNLAYALEERGYLDETVGSIDHAEPKIEGNRISVTLTGTATPGSRYTVSQVTLPARVGTVAAADLESEHQVKQGGLPSPSLVKNTVARMAFVFAGHGFLDAKAAVDSQKDGAAHTIAFTFTVTPGEVYRMRELEFASDLNPEQKTLLTQAWKLPRGAVYERATSERSLESLKTLCNGHRVSDKLLPSAASHEVDVSLSCNAQR